MSRASYLGRFASSNKGTSKARVSHGKQKPPTKVNYVADGSDITLGAVYAGNTTILVSSYADLLGAKNYATVHSHVANAVARDSQYTSNVASGSVFTYMVEDDLYSSSNTYMDTLATYLDHMRASGYWVTLLTTLPRDDSFGVFNAMFQWNNALRESQNITLRGWVGLHCDSLCDFANVASMGNVRDANVYVQYSGNFIQCSNGTFAPITSNSTFTNAPAIYPTQLGHSLLRDALKDHWKALGINTT